MTYSQFLCQIEALMLIQKIKNKEQALEGSRYKWLMKRQTLLTILSSKDEFMMRQAMKMVTEEQKQQVINHLVLWLKERPNVAIQDIPKMCVTFLNNVSHKISQKRGFKKNAWIV